MQVHILVFVVMIIHPLPELRLSEAKEQGSLSTNFLRTLQRTFGAHCFIETGTFLGNTALRASQIFSEVYTIELSDSLYHQNLFKFAAHNNIYSYLGESDRLLNIILSSIQNQCCIVYLDAHFSEGGTARGPENTPLLAEIKAIGSHMNSAIIIIDDIRLCQLDERIAEQVAQDPFYYKSITGYPSLTKLREEILKINPLYEFAVFGDMALIFPRDKHLQISLSSVMQAMTVSRLFEESSMSINRTVDVLLAEREILLAQGEEKIAIQQLLLESEGRYTPPFLTTHYKLWNALICIHDQQYKKAINLLTDAYNLGFTHWRIQWYQALAHYYVGEYVSAKRLLEHIRKELVSINLDEALFMLQKLEGYLC